VDTRQLLAVELIAQPRSVLVADLASQRDRFRDDVICGDQMVDEPQILERSKTSTTRKWWAFSLRNEREDESSVEEDHTFG
jgi:hypothetical protein